MVCKSIFIFALLYGVAAKCDFASIVTPLLDPSCTCPSYHNTTCRELAARFMFEDVDEKIKEEPFPPYEYDLPLYDLENEPETPQIKKNTWTRVISTCIIYLNRIAFVLICIWGVYNVLF